LREKAKQEYKIQKAVSENQLPVIKTEQQILSPNCKQTASGSDKAHELFLKPLGCLDLVTTESNSFIETNWIIIITPKLDLNLNEYKEKYSPNEETNRLISHQVQV